MDYVTHIHSSGGVHWSKLSMKAYLNSSTSVKFKGLCENRQKVHRKRYGLNLEIEYSFFFNKLEYYL
jgi:hypothetical protein